MELSSFVLMLQRKNHEYVEKANRKNYVYHIIPKPSYFTSFPLFSSLIFSISIFKSNKFTISCPDFGSVKLDWKFRNKVSCFAQLQKI